MTRCVFGSRRWISSITPIARIVAVGLARELVGAVRGAHGDGERVDLGLGDEVDGLVGIGEQLVVREHALGAVAVLLLAGAVLERAEHAELALDRDAAEMRHLGDLAGDLDVVVVARRRLAVGLRASRPSSPR